MTFLAVAAGLVSAASSIVLGYVLWLVTARRRPPVETSRPAELPSLLVVIPVFDEEPLIERKLENLVALDYPPGKLRVVVADGGSTDATVGHALRWMAGRPRYELLETNLRNKTAQLDAALRAFPDEEWILVTDADALLSPDTARALVAATADRDVGVVGASVHPLSAHELESLHWHATDWLREREADRGSAAIVAAPCYLAHRSLLADLPPDTVADDVHVACRAMLAGRRVAYAPSTVLELRSPRSLRALVRHKYRKGDAYLREVFRFLPEARRMPMPARAVFLWRAALLTLVPLLGTLGAVALVAALGSLSSEQAAAATVAIALLFNVKAARGFVLAALLAAVSAAALLTQPFSRQAASFPKIVPPSEYPLPDEAN